MFNLFEKFRDWKIIFITWRYTYIGMIYGDMMSYSYMGKPVGYDKVKKKYIYWGVKYANLGFKLVPLEDFITAGGYEGPDFLKDKLYIKE